MKVHNIKTIKNDNLIVSTVHCTYCLYSYISMTKFSMKYFFHVTMFMTPNIIKSTD